MSNTNNTLKGKINTNTIIGLGLLTAIVVVMQFISMGLRFGTFSITPVSYTHLTLPTN